MRAARALWRDQRATGAAEFALILPVALLFLLGIIDVGRYVWRINEAEKGVQQGVRYAVVTAMVPSSLATADFTGSTACGSALTAGDTICAAALPTVSCTSTGCTPATYGFNTTNFNNILGRIQVMAPFVKAANLTVEYTGSGVGYAGDPTGADVAPIVTVKLQNIAFDASILLGANVAMPTIQRSQTLEDGLGNTSN
jgi:Flp pilus assembly protein TadG